MKLGFILTFSNIPGFRNNNRSSIKVHDLRRCICLSGLKLPYLLPSPTSATKLFRLKRWGIIASTELRVSIIISGASISIHIFQLSVAFASGGGRQVRLDGFALIQIAIRKLTKLIIGPSSEIAAKLSFLVVNFICAKLVAILLSFYLVRSGDWCLRWITHLV